MTADILIAEHRRPLTAFLRYALADEGYDVRTVKNGTAALSAIRRSKPQIVLLDADLPDIDGIEVLLQLKSHERTCDVSIIMIAEEARPEKTHAALTMGASCVIAKPVSKPDLLAQVRNVFSLQGCRHTSAHYLDATKDGCPCSRS